MCSRPSDTNTQSSGLRTQELLQSATRLQKEFVERLAHRRERASAVGSPPPCAAPPELDSESDRDATYEAPLGTEFLLGPRQENTVLIRWGGPAGQGFSGQTSVYLSDVLQFEAAAQEFIPATAAATSSTQELGRQVTALTEELHLRRAANDATYNPGWQNRELAEVFGEGNYAPLYLANFGTSFVVLEAANAVSIRCSLGAFGDEAMVPLSDLHAFALQLWAAADPPKAATDSDAFRH